LVQPMLVDDDTPIASDTTGHTPRARFSPATPEVRARNPAGQPAMRRSVGVPISKL
jgi:hypothetical protein